MARAKKGSPKEGRPASASPPRVSDGLPRVSAARPSEEILINALHRIPDGRVLCTSVGRGQFAAALAQNRRTQNHPTASVCCWFLDLWQRNLAAESQAEDLANLRFECRADFPEEEVDAFVMPVTSAGDGELVRDLLQAGHQRLCKGGVMLIATDNPSDSWLHDELRKKFAKVTRDPCPQGTLFTATKTEPLRKIKNYECNFAFRDEGRLIQLVSRPGLFSHRSLDGGARALLRTMVVGPGQRVLELGCGSGGVSLAAAVRAEGVRVHALDSNARAVECTRRGAELNGLSNLVVHLETAETLAEQEFFPEPFDLVVANPPYYSNYRIAEIFARAMERTLKQDGTALFVTKRSEWYEERLPDLFSSVAVEPVGSYLVVRCSGRRHQRPAGTAGVEAADSSHSRQLPSVLR